MVKWSVPAKNDLKQIFDYISQDSQYYAKNVVHNIIEKTELLNDFPEMGRVVPEVGETNVRELFFYSYRVIYEITPESISILAIAHGKRDFTAEDLNR
ncbi:MAG: type II toxin-antitoxin system RelE/ParE family toxin [Candidatus Omnitrophota bacterium]